MWTCPLVFCDFEKFAQKCLFVFAAADFPCTGAFHVSSACICRMENGVHPSQIRFKPCDEMHLVFRFPTRPTLCFSGRRPAFHAIAFLWPAFHAIAFLSAAAGSLLLVHGIPQLIVCAGLHFVSRLLLFHQPVVWAAHLPPVHFACSATLGHLVHPLPHGCNAPQSPVFGPPDPLRSWQW